MTKLKNPIQFETAFATYSADEVIGEGGAGRVYAASAPDGSSVAVKLLADERAPREKRGRFKNEIAFLERNTHRNIVTVFDHGLHRIGATTGPFYVMQRYDCSLRELLVRGLPPEQVMPLFAQVIDGVEAAHLQGVVHRDLKPENLLFDQRTNTLAVADFGVARFNEDALVTAVKTSPAQRLANFQYAAPEQRSPGHKIGTAADLYALGLILNEMFTGVVPHGTEYKLVAGVAAQFGYLDNLVIELLRQNPTDRLGTILDLKLKLQRHQTESIALQRLSALSGEVVPVGSIDDPQALVPPKIVGVDWNAGRLVLELDRTVSQEWIECFRNMGNFSYVAGSSPERFGFEGNQASARVSEYAVQDVVNHFKDWLPIATNALRQQQEAAAGRAERMRREAIRQQSEDEERRLRVLRNIKI